MGKGPLISVMSSEARACCAKNGLVSLNKAPGFLSVFVSLLLLQSRHKKLVLFMVGEEQNRKDRTGTRQNEKVGIKCFLI